MSENNNKQNIGESAVARVKKRSMLKRQRLAIIVLSAVMVLLVASVFAVNYLIGIYVYPDSDGTDYHIKKVDGEYALCYKNGDVLDRSADGYYITDLGTEINNQFTTSCLYNVINTRLNKKRATVVSTNLSQDEFRKRYWDRITSRIFGEYLVMPFCGEDIRSQKVKNIVRNK